MVNRRARPEQLEQQIGVVGGAAEGVELDAQVEQAEKRASSSQHGEATSAKAHGDAEGPISREASAHRLKLLEQGFQLLRLPPQLVTQLEHVLLKTEAMLEHVLLERGRQSSRAIVADAIAVEVERHE